MKRFKQISTAIMLLFVFTVVSILPALQATSAKAATSVELNKSKLTLYVGKSYSLKVTGTAAAVTWKSNKTSVATVTKAGKVTAKSAGSATITATVDSEKYTCKVTVKNATVVYGKVTVISGKKVTLALGTMNQPNQGTKPSGTPAAPSGTPAAPSGTPSNSSGTTGGAPDLLTLTGKSITITISDTSILSKESMQIPDKQSSSSSTSSTSTSSSSSASSKTSSATLSDITVGSILKVTYTSSISDLTSVVIMGGGGMIGAGTSTPGASTVVTGTGAYNLTNGEALNGGTYTSTNADENAIRADNSITASLTDVVVTKSAGAASNSDASSFYGLNAAILALGGATLNISGGSVSASAEGANGVFAYDGATINISDTTIDVSGGNAGGIEVAGGGIMNATNLTVTAKVKAAIRSDQGCGTLTVKGGTYTTSGSSGAPAVYSTANITVSDATLVANTSEAVVVEGLNSVTLNDCTVTGNMSGTYGSNSNENIHNVMLYQSMSGDAEVGNSSFTMKGGSLTSKNGDMFYMTNTEGVITLTNVVLTLATDTNLLVVAGNSGSRGWGTSGSNGGDCTFVASNQTLAGNINVDKISKLKMTIKNSSTYAGSINSDGTTASELSVTLDSTSTWTLTADSYVTEFNGSISNVVTNGHTLYVNGVAMN